MSTVTETECMLYPVVTTISGNNNSLSLIDNQPDNFVLPPTPTPSDDEDSLPPHPSLLKLSRRGTVSLVDLIPVASAALRAKQKLSIQSNNPPSTQDSPLARALTKVKIGVQTHRIKERYLTNEWIRLALATPLDDSTINSQLRILKTNRTKEIVRWYEYKFKKFSLSLEEIENRVDLLRRQRVLLLVQPPLTPPPTIATF